MFGDDRWRSMTYLHRQANSKGATVPNMLRMFHGDAPLVGGHFLWFSNVLVVKVLHVCCILRAKRMVLEVRSKLIRCPWNRMGRRNRSRNTTVGVRN